MVAGAAMHLNGHMRQADDAGQPPLIDIRILWIIRDHRGDHAGMPRTEPP